MRIQASILALMMAAPLMAQEAPTLEITIAEADGTEKGVVEIELRPDLAPNHAERLITLAENGAYDGVVFHRVIDGFMAQTGDVQYGNISGDLVGAGRGGSNLNDLDAEFSQESFDRGVVGMARAQSFDSANSQFFIMFEAGEFLDGNYTIIGSVVEGMDVIDDIKRGDGSNGAVTSAPDYMKSVVVNTPE